MKELLKQFWTIPNMLTLFRVICVPFVMWCTIDQDTYLQVGEYSLPLIGLIIMVVAASSDLVDGFIARRFNQGTQLGEMLDPLADKLMHCATILSLVIIGFVGTMVLGGIYMAGDSKNIKANYMGKVASATLSLAIIMSFFHPFWATKVFYLDWIVLGIGLVLTYMAFFNYLKQAVAIIKGIMAKKAAARAGGSVSAESEPANTGTDEKEDAACDKDASSEAEQNK